MLTGGEIPTAVSGEIPTLEWRDPNRNQLISGEIPTTNGEIPSIPEPNHGEIPTNTNCKWRYPDI